MKYQIGICVKDREYRYLNIPSLNDGSVNYDALQVAIRFMKVNFELTKSFNFLTNGDVENFRNYTDGTKTTVVKFVTYDRLRIKFKFDEPFHEIVDKINVELAKTPEERAIRKSKVKKTEVENPVKIADREKWIKNYERYSGKKYNG